ncbi:hypothetical protein BX600DRAFT_476272 [Xylariales sp. PMI_506]|nr:hypothetical protein BX600DRAFT_476272 [Xylariales sp. PMI_506]
MYASSIMSNGPYDLLVNMFATSLFVFNPVFMQAVFHGPWPDSLQPDLPEEFRMRAATARRINQIVPARWSVYAFITSGTALLAFILLALAAADPFHTETASAFGVVDLLKLQFQDDAAPGQPARDTELKDLVQGEVSDGRIIKRAQSVHCAAA